MRSQGCGHLKPESEHCCTLHLLWPSKYVCAELSVSWAESISAVSSFAPGRDAVGGIRCADHIGAGGPQTALMSFHPGVM